MRFLDKELEQFWLDPLASQPRKVPPDLRKTLFRKLQMLSAACSIEDLRVPPGNRLEALKGSKAGHYSIRVNDKWRLCFRWISNEAIGVEFVDYHR